MDHYPEKQQQIGLANRISNNLKVWVLCDCRDLSVLRPDAFQKSKTCRQCSNKRHNYQIAVEAVYRKKKAILYKKTKSPICIKCGQPSIAMVCSSCVVPIYNLKQRVAKRVNSHD